MSVSKNADVNDPLKVILIKKFLPEKLTLLPLFKILAFPWKSTRAGRLNTVHLLPILPPVTKITFQTTLTTPYSFDFFGGKNRPNRWPFRLRLFDRFDGDGRTVFKEDLGPTE